MSSQPQEAASYYICNRKLEIQRNNDVPLTNARITALLFFESQLTIPDMSKYHLNCTKDKVPPKKKKQPKPQPGSNPNPGTRKPRQDDTGLLALINPNRPCCCEVMSKALSDDLPKRIGLSTRRAALQLGRDDPLDCNPVNLFESENNDSSDSKDLGETTDCCADAKENKK